MFGLNKILQQLQQSENDFRKIVVCVERGDGAVGLFMNGLQEVVEVRFGADAPDLLAAGRLAAMLGEAFNEALRESRRLLKEEISRLTGVSNLPEIPGIF
ncbi:MAG: YbaB/EbfC family nucleoid-associated protein [Bacillota bacterium]